jgi:metal-responsive CopG/Arc/MetJ family transcriptional regulator
MAREAELTERTVVLLAPEMVAAIDNYRKRGETIPSRGEAIRQLVEEGLKAVEKRDKTKR